MLNYKQSHGLGFYHLSDTGRIKANAAYLVKPITYLTQWKIVGNSEVHTDPYLTSWKVSGNSVVDNNTILSCGDLGQDGKYHVKISNGVTVYDIPLDAPLRKVGDVADTIEFPSDTEGKALVTRNLCSVDLGDLDWTHRTDITQGLFSTNLLNRNYSQFNFVALCANWTRWKDSVSGAGIARNMPDYNYVPYYISTNPYSSICYFKNSNYSTTDAFKQSVSGIEFIYNLATPTTELIDVSPFPVSPTDTYTSANVVPYSAFEHTKNVEIWSCGEYNPIDGKYHILVQPQGGSIADIALDEPLRKVNDVADTIEFPSDTEGKALVTRNTSSIDLGTCTYSSVANGYYSDNVRNLALKPQSGQSMDVLCTAYPNAENPWVAGCMGISTSGSIWIGDKSYESATAIKNALAGVEMIYKLATPTTELIDAPLIQEAESYSCVITPGGKAVSWSSFEKE